MEVFDLSSSWTFGAWMMVVILPLITSLILVYDFKFGGDKK